MHLRNCVITAQMTNVSLGSISLQGPFQGQDEGVQLLPVPRPCSQHGLARAHTSALPGPCSRLMSYCSCTISLEPWRMCPDAAPQGLAGQGCSAGLELCPQPCAGPAALAGPAVSQGMLFPHLPPAAGLAVLQPINNAPNGSWAAVRLLTLCISLHNIQVPDLCQKGRAVFVRRGQTAAAAGFGGVW